MTFTHRLVGALRLDAASFEDVEADTDALRQALVVVIAFGIAAGLGLGATPPTPRSFAVAVAGSLAGWLSWACLVYYLGAKAFPEAQTRADIGELARTIGFSAAPGLFLPLLAVPVVRPVTFAVISLWMLAAMVVAVRQALDFSSTLRAVAVCVAGAALAILLALVIGSALGPRVY